MESISQLIIKQNEFFSRGYTKDIGYRRKMLLTLKKAIVDNEDKIIEALHSDLNKSPFEAYVTEIGIVIEEINFMLKHMNRFFKPKRVNTPLMHFKATSRIYNEPYGSVLIMSPWNYPFQLALAPLVGAIAGGNCAVVKPSEYSVETSKIVARIITEIFPEEYITVIEGGVEVNQQLLDNRFDLIFFTGSTEVGKIVMSKAAKYLTPVVLELGGKSPCIVDKTANIKLAAKRIVWGKCLNAGQTCVAPDYLLVHRSVKKELIEEMKKWTETFFGSKMHNNPDYPKIISENHFNRLNKLIATGKTVHGGQSNTETKQISLAIIDEVKWSDEVMQEELFGPILPIIEYDILDDIISEVSNRPKPLALYLFTNSKDNEDKVINNLSFGGGCINDTITHLASNIGFGGVGDSGIGQYHGLESLKVFTHSKSILKKSNWIDTPFRYAPYNKYLNIVKKIIK